MPIAYFLSPKFIFVLVPDPVETLGEPLRKGSCLTPGVRTGTDGKDRIGREEKFKLRHYRTPPGRFAGGAGALGWGGQPACR